MKNSQDKKSTERVDFAKMALLDDDLHAVEEQYGK